MNSIQDLDKVVFITHGIAGSGKSTCSKVIRVMAEDLGKTCEVFSTDDFWIEDSKYVFDACRLNEAHRWNRHRVFEAMNSLWREQPDWIVIDNTNLTYDECEPYIEAAFLKGYSVIFVEPSTPWKNDVNECFNRNTHGVPMNTLKRMMGRKESVSLMVGKARALASKIACITTVVDSVTI